MKTLLWMLCLTVSSVAVAQVQTYDYQGNVMTGDGATETYTASLTFYGPLTNSATPLDYLLSVGGTAYKFSWGCQGCAIGYIGSNIEPASIVVNSTNNVLTSAYITLISNGETQVPYVDIGAHGDSLTLTLASTGARQLFVSNDAPGIWTRAPEIDPSSAFGAMALLGALLLMVRGTPRSIRRPGEAPATQPRC
jgi:hypothetical protein